ncbi:MAG: hypothetical protein OSA11_02315 [Candidatus Nanopelagicales bacterium]|nr:hypothetical protein [Candidatus Nanopelagicales bacterium]
MAHRESKLTGEFFRTRNLTDIITRWVHAQAVRNNEYLRDQAALNHIIEGILFDVTGMDFDSGSLFIDDDVIEWANDLDIDFNRSWRYKKNGQLAIQVEKII